MTAPDDLVGQLDALDAELVDAVTALVAELRTDS